MPAHRRAAAASLAALLAAGGLVACGDDTGGEGATPEPTTSSADTTVEAGSEDALPPTDFESLREILQPMFDDFDLEVTRASVSPLQTGQHLAVYVEPTGPSTPEQFAERIIPTLAAFAPEVVSRYGGLATIDLCQEPVPGPDDPRIPPPETLVFLSADQVRSVDDWDTLTLTELVVLTRSDGGAGRIDVSEAVSATEDFQEAG